jgi:nucleotide-binding universal stress UspA family protein
MKILLAIDDSACSEAAVQAVIEQFRPEGSEVRVLHVDEWPKGLSTSLAFAEGPGAASDLVAAHAELRHRAEALIADASRRLKSARFRTQTEMRDGDARHAILDCADEWRPDVVVLGSHGRKGLDRFLLGSVSESVLRHARCSVQVIREPSSS